MLGGCTSFDSYVWNCAGLCIGQNILDIYALRKQYIKSGTGGVRGGVKWGQWWVEKNKIELFLCTFFGYFAIILIIPSQTRFSLQIIFSIAFFVQSIYFNKPYLRQSVSLKCHVVREGRARSARWAQVGTVLWKCNGTAKRSKEKNN